MLTQSAPQCAAFNFSPPTAAFPAIGGLGSVNCDKGSVSNGVYTGCPWTAVSNVPWILITSGSASNDTGFGVVQYAVAPNLTKQSRTGTLTFSSGSYGSATYTISQDAAISNLAAAPNSISFDYQAGTLAPPAQSALVFALTGQVTFTPIAVTSSDLAWLLVGPSTASTPTTLSVSVAPQGLAPGTYTGEIRAADTPGAPAQTIITVTLNVFQAGFVVPSVITSRFDVTQPNAVPTPPPVPVLSPTGAQTAVTATVSFPAGGGGWLFPTVVSGSTPFTIQFGLSPESLAPGTYVAVVSYSPSESTPASPTPGAAANTAPQTAFVLDVGPQSPLIATPDDMVFDDDSGPTQPVALTAISQQYTLNSTAIVLTGPPGWLTVNPPTRSTNTSFTISTPGAGLAPGGYRGLVAFSDANTAIGKLVKVEKLVGSAAGYVSNDRDSLNFPFETGGPPPARQPVTLSGTYNGTATVSATSDTGWLHAPASVSIPGVLMITADPTGLQENNYAGAVVIKPADPTVPPVTVAAALAVQAPQPTGPNRQAISQIAFGDVWNTQITLVNADAGDAQFQLNFFGDDGNPLQVPLAGIGTVTQYPGTIKAGGSRTISTAGGAAITQGWAELQTQNAIGGVAIFQSTAPGVPQFEAASPIAPQAGGRFLLPFDNAQGMVTSMALVNTSVQQTTVSVAIRDALGNPILTDSIPLPAHGHLGLRFPGKYPVLDGLRGVAEFSSPDSGLTALGLRFNPGGAFTSFPILTAADIAAGAGRRVMCQIADGQAWKTSVMLVNGGISQASALLNFFKDDGSKLALGFEGIGAGSELQSPVSASGSSIAATSDTANQVSQGWASLSGSQGLGGMAIFRSRVPGRRDFEAASPLLRSVGTTMLLPFDNTQGFVTSVALLNPSDFPATITVSVRDEGGAQITAGSIPLPSRGHTGFATPERFAASAGLRGVIEFSSPAGVAVLGLRFNPGGAFTSLPAVPR